MMTRAKNSLVTALIPLCLLGVAQTADGSNIDPVDKWAWSTNTGWVNFNPTYGGVTVYADHLEGFAWGENIGWIRLGSYSGAMSHSYGNTSPDDYGVNHDGAGNLWGYAWGANVGWINFAPTDGGVTIDPATGSFSGYAWAENVGWINFNGGGTIAYNVVARQVHGWPIPAVDTPGVVVLTLLLAGIGVMLISRIRMVSA